MGRKLTQRVTLRSVLSMKETSLLLRLFPILTLVLVLSPYLAACSGQDRAPPNVPGVQLDRLTQEELNLYRRVLMEELSPCGGRVTLEQDLRQGRCALSPLAARLIAYRVEENDTREEISERYLARYGAVPRRVIDVEGSPVLGEANAPVTLVVFSDFQCPHCARAAASLRETVEESDGRVKLVFRNFPLLRQQVSMTAAIASLAAHQQGRFWALHDAMYQNRTRLNQEVILGLAEELGLDMEQFRDSLLDPAIEAQVRSEREQGEELGVRGTPTLFINGRMFNESFSRLQFALEEEIVRAQMNQSSSGASDSETGTADSSSEAQGDSGDTD